MKNRRIVISVFALLCLALIAIANIPPPPVDQTIGLARDTSINILNATDCKTCHISGVNTRHHDLAKTDGTGDINPMTGLVFVCKDCHPIVSGPNGQSATIERNCVNCHNGTAFWANPTKVDPNRPHHNTQWARDRNCKQCHGFVDNYNDGHYMPDYGVSEITPDTSYKIYNASSGRYWGGCEACHQENLAQKIWQNAETHHSEILEVTEGYACEWCHVAAGSALDVRRCEDCHSIQTLHNIQYNYSLTDGMRGYGHVGDNWDCNGCHAYWDAGDVSGWEGAILPNLVSVTPNKLTTNVPATLTLRGSDFLSGSGNYTAVVVIDGTNYTATTITSDTITLDVTLPQGSHTVTVVKYGDVLTRQTPMKSIIVEDPVNITSAVLTNKGKKTSTITITGIGFGTQPEPEYTTLGVFVGSGTRITTAEIVSWSNTQIVAKVKTSAAVIGTPVTLKALGGEDSEPLTQ